MVPEISGWMWREIRDLCPMRQDLGIFRPYDPWKQLNGTQ